jgi:hypothetical protein
MARLRFRTGRVRELSVFIVVIMRLTLVVMRMLAALS